MSPHDDAVDTTVHGVPGVSVAPLPSLRCRVWARHCHSLVNMSLPSLAREFPYPYVAVVITVTICHKGDTVKFSGQGTTSGLSFYPKRLCR